MKKRRKTLRAVLLATALVITGILPFAREPVRADSGTTAFTYDKDTGMLSGELTTTGENSITRLEFYFTNTYEYGQYNVTIRDMSQAGIATLNADLIQVEGTLTGNAEVVYGGTVNVDQYDLNCVIYYIITGSEINWNVNVKMEDTLSECIVAKTTVPTDWQNTASAYITTPEEICLYFVDTNTSTITGMSVMSEIVNAGAINNSINAEYATVEPDEEPEGMDAMTLLLIVLLIITAIAIGATWYILQKEKKKKEAERSERFVTRANEEVKKKKARENDELRELVDGYDDEYLDEGDVPEHATYGPPEESIPEAQSAPEMQRTPPAPKEPVVQTPMQQTPVQQASTQQTQVPQQAAAMGAVTNAMTGAAYAQDNAGMTMQAVQGTPPMRMQQQAVQGTPPMRMQQQAPQQAYPGYPGYPAYPGAAYTQGMPAQQTVPQQGILQQIQAQQMPQIQQPGYPHGGVPGMQTQPNVAAQQAQLYDEPHQIYESTPAFATPAFATATPQEKRTPKFAKS